MVPANDEHAERARPTLVHPQAMSDTGIIIFNLMHDTGVKLLRPTINPPGLIDPVSALFQRKAFTSKHPNMVRFRGIPDNVTFELESRSGAGWLRCLPKGECRLGGWLVGW